MYNNQEVEYLSKEIMISYPSIDEVDARELAINLMYGMEAIRQNLILDIYQQVWYNNIYNNLC